MSTLKRKRAHWSHKHSIKRVAKIYTHVRNTRPSCYHFNFLSFPLSLCLLLFVYCFSGPAANRLTYITYFTQCCCTHKHERKRRIIARRKYYEHVVFIISIIACTFSERQRCRQRGVSGPALQHHLHCIYTATNCSVSTMHSFCPAWSMEAHAAAPNKLYVIPYSDA